MAIWHLKDTSQKAVPTLTFLLPHIRWTKRRGNYQILISCFLMDNFLFAVIFPIYKSALAPNTIQHFYPVNSHQKSSKVRS